jgi:hypothetical protein
MEVEAQARQLWNRQRTHTAELRLNSPNSNKGTKSDIEIAPALATILKGYFYTNLVGTLISREHKNPGA